MIAQDYDFIPSIDPVLSMDHGEIIYDYCWLPTMTTTGIFSFFSRKYLDPKTCFFFTTSKGHPIRMWDAFSGRLAASYRGYNAADELDSSTAIIVTDQQIFAGFQKSIKIFQLDTPGRSYTSVPIPKDATSGIRSVSTIAIQDPSRKYDFSRVVAVGMHHNKVGLLSAQGDQDWIGWIDNKVAENDKNCGTGVSKVCV